jgi:hypothetical protein
LQFQTEREFFTREDGLSFQMMLSRCSNGELITKTSWEWRRSGLAQSTGLSKTTEGMVSPSVDDFAGGGFVVESWWRGNWIAGVRNESSGSFWRTARVRFSG